MDKLLVHLSGGRGTGGRLILTSKPLPKRGVCVPFHRGEAPPVKKSAECQKEEKGIAGKVKGWGGELSNGKWADGLLTPMEKKPRTRA